MKTREERNLSEKLNIDVPSRLSVPGLGPVRSMRHLKASELCNGSQSCLPELIVEKLQSLDTHRFTERRVASKARLLLELLRDTLSGRYPGLSMIAFAEILLAMHHFIEVRDEIPDTYDGGMLDDMRKLEEVGKHHRREIEAYMNWSRTRRA